MLDFVTPAREVALSLVSGRAHYDQVVKPLLGARTSVWVATANLKNLMVLAEDLPPPRMPTAERYRPALEALERLAGRGVELRVLHAGRPSSVFGEALARQRGLAGGGLELRQCPRVHCKVVVVDGELLYLGSANWTGAGLGVRSATKRNVELGVLTRDATLIDQIQATLDRVWRGEACEGCGLRRRCDRPLAG